MDPVSLLVTALAAGAAKGVGETASAAVRDAYQELKARVASRFAGHAPKELVLAEHEKQPDTWRAPLTEAINESGLASDSAVLDLAERLMALLDEAGTRAGKYNVDASGAQGVQIGDHNQQANTFTTPPAPQRP